jgi:hypothetical protein
MRENRGRHFIKSMQLIFYYKKFEFRNNSIDSNQKFTSENNFDEQFTSFDLMDFLPDTSSSVKSIQYQTNEQINVYQNNKKTRIGKKIFLFVRF